jgi:hypothetical protein
VTAKEDTMKKGDAGWEESAEFYRRYALAKLQAGTQTAADLRKRALDDQSMLDVVAEGAKRALRQWG